MLLPAMRAGRSRPDPISSIPSRRTGRLLLLEAIVCGVLSIHAVTAAAAVRRPRLTKMHVG